ncbi:MAG: TetR family transcriptional regulator [Polaromonas sp.]|uniref:TetR/AcrR family transcriptional regulator n=1 Tax=Polaromonas sp. TaxID=1869339 RepID=UPI0017F4C8D7|nr:TetR/AcrR family transcriptional regulator [Polaromonas sp.]MBA3592943.1 TetR family transcriptional regulator [Polaromonas sp.]
MDNTRTRREEYAEATRAALLETAGGMFAAEGFHATGIEGIARAARVTRGALYHHFTDKKALFEALVVELQEQVALRVRDLASVERDPLQQMKVGVAAFLDECSEPAYRRLVIEDAPAVLGTRRCREIEDASAIGLLVAAVAGLKKAGVLNVANAEVAGRMIGAMICEAALLMGYAAKPTELKRQAVKLVSEMVDALRVR